MPGPRYVKDFEFPRSAGFHGSADKVEGRMQVRSYTRATPQRFAEGGVVKAPSNKPIPPMPKQPIDKSPPPKADTGHPSGGVIDALRGKSRRQKEANLGLKKGGRVKHRNLTAKEHEEIDRENYGNRVRELHRDPKSGGLVTKSASKRAYASGGRVNGASTIGRAMPTTEADKETGGKTPLRTGYKSGGKAKKSIGGPVKYAKGGNAK